MLQNVIVKDRENTHREKGRRSIYKFVLAVVLFALAACLNGCHGVNW